MRERLQSTDRAILAPANTCCCSRAGLCGEFDEGPIGGGDSPEDLGDNAVLIRLAVDLFAEPFQTTLVSLGSVHAIGQKLLWRQCRRRFGHCTLVSGASGWTQWADLRSGVGSIVQL